MSKSKSGRINLSNYNNINNCYLQGYSLYAARGHEENQRHGSQPVASVRSKTEIRKINSYITPPVLRTHVCNLFIYLFNNMIYSKNGQKSWSVKGNKAC